MVSPAAISNATALIQRSSKASSEYVVAMANVIKPWLWPGIELELRRTLEWKAGAPGSTPAGRVPKYEDDFSNLRVQSTQLKNCVQILRVRSWSCLIGGTC